MKTAKECENATVGGNSLSDKKKTFDANSATRPNGFAAGVYQSCWEIIKNDLLLIV